MPRHVTWSRAAARASKLEKGRTCYTTTAERWRAMNMLASKLTLGQSRGQNNYT